MKQMDLLGGRTAPQEVFTDEQVSRFIDVVGHYLPDNVALSGDEDIDGLYHRVQFYTEDDNFEKDYIVDFMYNRRTQELYVDMLDVYKFGIPMWTEVVHIILTLGAETKCRCIIFNGGEGSGDIYAGHEPMGATKQPNGSWVCALREA